MDTLHAPWRIEYILSPKAPASEDSLFTRIAQSQDDLTNLVIARSRASFAVLNRYPYTGGHLMVVPYRQTAELGDLSGDESADLIALLNRCVAALREVMHPQGFNIGMNLGQCAGAGILGHLHIHVVPRWSGDTNFMPVLAGTTVVPEALTDLAVRLRAVLDRA
jgi:ATP adenylyltransferase